MQEDEQAYQQALDKWFKPPGYSYSFIYQVYANQGRFIPVLIGGEYFYVPIYSDTTVLELLDEVASRVVGKADVYVDDASLTSYQFLGVVNDSRGNLIAVEGPAYVSSRLGTLPLPGGQVSSMYTSPTVRLIVELV